MNPYSSVLSGNGRYVMALLRGLGGIRLYDLRTRQHWDVIKNYLPNGPDVLMSKSGRYVAYFYSPRNSGRGSIVRWDRSSGKETTVARKVRSNDFSMSQDGRYFGYWGTDLRMRRTDVETGRSVEVYDATAEPSFLTTENMAMSRDGETIAYLVLKMNPNEEGSKYRYSLCDLHVWHADDRARSTASFDEPEGCLYSRDMAVTNNGRYVVVDPGDGPPYYRHDSETGLTTVLSLPVPSGCTQDDFEEKAGVYGTVSPDARYMLVSTPKGCRVTGFLWDIATNRVVLNLPRGYPQNLTTGGRHALVWTRDPAKQIVNTVDLAIWSR